jgi:hypothetical protein
MAGHPLCYRICSPFAAVKLTDTALEIWHSSRNVDHRNMAELLE